MRSLFRVSAIVPRPLRQLARRAMPGTVSCFDHMELFDRGSKYADDYVPPAASNADLNAGPNALERYFNEHREGPGIWKWRHYFDIYDRHFQKFRGSEVHVLEIGIYSGGSLGMWRDYFGPQGHIYGVDIEESCRAYEDAQTTVFIGDQADRAFWRSVKREAPAIDIVIDDGGHETEQQIVTLEELLPHLRPGGVYLCEDVHGAANGFATYVSGLTHQLNHHLPLTDCDSTERRSASRASHFQSAIHSVHCYPYLTVIERNKRPAAEFTSAKHGSEWQPFLR